MSVQINRNYGLIDVTTVPDEYLDLMRFLKSNNYTDREIKVILDDRIRSVDYKIQNDSEYGKVLREDRNPDKDNVLYHLTPFGLENGRIILPDVYKKLDTDDETIYNLCMYSTNYYFWFLLSFDQKYKLYKLFEKNINFRVFGYNYEIVDFEKLHDVLYDLIANYDKTDSLQAIRYKMMSENEPNKLLHKDFLSMIQLNMERDVIFCKYKWMIKDILIGDQIIESNLKPYIPLIWFFNRENYIFKSIRSEDYQLNGTPQVRVIRYSESPIN